MKKPASSGKFIEATGRRKTAIARVRIQTQTAPQYIINAKPFDIYFQDKELQGIVQEPFNKVATESKFGATILVQGGGLRAQAEAVRHGISRALIQFNEELKSPLKKLGFLTRDPRMRERKKFGLRRARRARQWRKR